MNTIKPNGLHHLAISTADIKSQIEFFTSVLGMELVALYWMHGVEGAWHGFMRLDEQQSVAFVFTPQNSKIESKIGLTHPGNAGESSAPGTMQHLALNVDSQDALLAMRDRIRSKGVVCIGPVHHGFCSSVYFAGPENLSLEISTSGGVEHPLAKNDTWIDPEVVALAGINEDELQRYMNPELFERPAEPVAQASIDAKQPHLLYPDEIYAALVGAPDEAITADWSDTTPPNVPVGNAAE